ncbi:MAG: type VI secretion system protein TssL, long form [Kiloniellales bacterium]|nr:type VI secretion system protein TssL, long form [Kiloniellales bacterium]
MSGRDPFEDFDLGEEDFERTIILPTPGGSRRGTEQTDAPSTAFQGRFDPGEAMVASGKNPLLSGAATAFALARQLRRTPHHDDPEGLREAALRMIKGFETSARQGGASDQAVHAGRYALCALVDEAVLSTPWGSGSIWSKQSLLGTLHNETRGGAKFFNILSKMMQNPAHNLDLLELLYVCLALGFQGKFGVQDRGEAQLGEITRNLNETIRQIRGEPERELSPSWQGIVDRRPKAARYIPLWVVPVAVCALAVIGYLTFNHYLNRSSDAVFVELNGLVRAAPPLSESQAAVIRQLVPDPPQRDAAAEPGLYEQVYEAMAAERREGLMDVIDEGARIKIVIHNQGLFGSGSARVSGSHAPVLRKLAQVLRGAPSPIHVIGHTDSQPIRTVRFPSNWHLSSSRAEAVARLMAETLRAPMELVTEGRADTEPIASNDTPEGRRQNRRIEIRVPIS